MISDKLKEKHKTYPIFINKKEKKLSVPNVNMIFDYKSKEDVDIYNECKNEIIQKILSLNEEKEIFNDSENKTKNTGYKFFSFIDIDYSKIIGDLDINEMIKNDFDLHIHEDKDNVIEFLNNQKTIAVSFSQKRFINQIKKLKEKFPESVYIVDETDGGIYAKLPVSFLRISKRKRNFTEEQRKNLFKKRETK